MTRWISVVEELPAIEAGKNSVKVLVTRQSGDTTHTETARMYPEEPGTFFDGESRLFGITHWMPLPVPPDITTSRLPWKLVVEKVEQYGNIYYTYEIHDADGKIVAYMYDTDRDGDVSPNHKDAANAELIVRLVNQMSAGQK